MEQISKKFILYDRTKPYIINKIDFELTRYIKDKKIEINLFYKLWQNIKKYYIKCEYDKSYNFQYSSLLVIIKEHGVFRAEYFIQINPANHFY